MRIEFYIFFSKEDDKKMEIPVEKKVKNRLKLFSQFFLRNYTETLKEKEEKKLLLFLSFIVLTTLIVRNLSTNQGHQILLQILLDLY